jgi:hypothetical protein
VHPRAFLREVAAVGRRHGGLAALQTLAEGMANAVMRLECLHVITLEREHLPGLDGEHQGQLAGRITSRIADEATLLAMRAEGGWAIDDVKLGHLRAGDHCLLSLLDGQVAGYTWVHDRGCPEILPGLRLQLPPGMLYNFAGYTHPRFRGSGLQSYRHRSVLDHPRWANASSLLGWVKATNFASRRGQGKSGYRPIGWIWLVGGSRRFAALCSPSLWERGIKRIPVASLPAPDRLPQSPA